MRSLRKARMPAVLLGATLMLAPPAVLADDLQSGESPQDSPEELAREGLEQMMRALRLLVESIPQYELPEVLDNGDIIIRRKHSKPESQEPEFDETAT
ncbi:hypothetical protein [Pelagibius marinus]|uniref:hypothetical protein n=1 Tax=Pelagibius marinus TaxID=2762760 RepID=UPI001872E30A|nr:hypothetical protein [Pelagibius marinus]